MSTSPNPTWQHTIKIESIVHLQDEDYEQMLTDLGDEPDDDTVIEYLTQWWYPGTHDIIYGREEDINTPFLGYVVSDYWLFSHNPKMGYASLSRIMKRG